MLEAHSQLLRSLKTPQGAEPRAGFYARVMERIEAQQPFSIWSVFLDRKFGFRLAVASGVLAALLGIYLVTLGTERTRDGCRYQRSNVRRGIRGAQRCRRATAA